MPRGRPRKEQTFDAEIRARLFQYQKELIQRASDHAATRRGTGTVSDWIRETLIQAAREELGEEVV